MAGNVRFESSSASPEELAFAGNYPNGQRANYPGASLDRSGSFREGSESRMFSSGTGMSRGSATLMGDVPPVSQWLVLDPITMDPKYTRLGELRRVLGVSFGGTAEDNSFGAAHSKPPPPPPVATEELKWFKASVLDASVKASGRAKKLNESLRKLNKYCEALNSKKQQRNEMLTNERSGGSNLLKMGTLVQRNSSDLVTQRLEDRTKNVVLSKRVRTSVAEIRAEGRSNTFVRQPLVMGKNRDMLKDGGEGSDLVEEKIRRLPAGGEGWEKKMRRKRSVSTVLTRPVDGDGEHKRVIHHKLNSEPGLQSYDAQGFRSGSSNDASGIHKLNGTSLSASSDARVVPKNELEKVSLSRDFMAGSTKERLVAKGNNKLNIREDNHAVSPGPVTKGKASRGPRTGPVPVANSSPSFPRACVAVDGWEQPPSVNKVHSAGGANTRKRPMPTGSSSPPMAQWVGQRPQKISRTRRANLVSPVSNHDEVQISSDGCAHSDLGARITSVGTNGLLLSRALANGTQQFRVKHENVSSPARVSESEESGAGENSESRMKEKGTGSSEVDERGVIAVHNFASSILLTKKKQTLNKDEIGDGVRRQGRSGRGSSYSKSSISPMREKVGNPASAKPLKSTRPSSDKNGSKSGRPPLKKMSDRKSFTRLGHTPIGSSPDLTGESDDREELLAAANFACNASNLACSGSFWKKMEPYFASISLEDISNLKQQVLKSTEELHEGLSQTCGHNNNVPGDLFHEDNCPVQNLVSGERDRSLKGQSQSKEAASTADLVDQDQEIGIFGGRSNSERRNKATPLYQRVLSALIVEDETDEFEENSGGRNMSFQYSRDDSSIGTCLPIDVEPWNRVEFQYESMLGLQAQKPCTADRFACNRSGTFNEDTGIHKKLCNDDLFQGSCGYMHSEIGMYPEYSESGGERPQIVHTKASGISSSNCQYEQMCLEDKLVLELQSVGIYPEAVPDLADGEEDVISQEIAELQRGLQHIGEKKAHMNQIIKAIEEVRETEGRGLEQVAMDRLVELAYKKLLATRGSNASKIGVAKVSKQVALAFMKRALAKCRKFEESGKSCFSEPALRGVIFAAPHGNIAESMNCFVSAVATNMLPESNNSQPEPRVSGSIPSRAAERHDLHNDKIGTLTHPSDQDFAKTGPILNRGKKKEILLDDVGGSVSLRDVSAHGNALLAGSKGKRSERERDKDALAKNSVAKAGRASLGNFKGERRTKSKPKQKTAQLSTSGSGFINKFTDTTHSVYSSANGSSEVVTDSNDKKREVGLVPHGSIPEDSCTEIKEPIDFVNLQHGLDEFGGQEDLSNWWDGLQDHDSAGLAIPMDDLSELNMLL